LPSCEVLHQRHQHFERGLEAVFSAGGGVMTLVVVNDRSALSIVSDAMAGDALAKSVLAAADQLLRRIERRTRATALPCLLCDRGLLWRGEAPGAVAVLMPYGIDPVRTAVGMALCASCAEDRTRADTAQAIVAKLRDGMLPDLRVFYPVAEAGHA
jgi:hypothetical protein